VGANGDSFPATSDHGKPQSMQLSDPLGDTRRRAAMLERCLLSSARPLCLDRGPSGRRSLQPNFPRLPYVGGCRVLLKIRLDAYESSKQSKTGRPLAQAEDLHSAGRVVIAVG
jgi:hypothetical protein